VSDISTRETIRSSSGSLTTKTSPSLIIANLLCRGQGRKTFAAGCWFRYHWLLISRNCFHQSGDTFTGHGRNKMNIDTGFFKDFLNFFLLILNFRQVDFINDHKLRFSASCESKRLNSLFTFIMLSSGRLSVRQSGDQQPGTHTVAQKNRAPVRDLNAAPSINPGISARNKIFKSLHQRLRQSVLW